MIDENISGLSVYSAKKNPHDGCFQFSFGGHLVRKRLELVGQKQAAWVAVNFETFALNFNNMSPFRRRFWKKKKEKRVEVEYLRGSNIFEVVFWRILDWLKLQAQPERACVIRKEAPTLNHHLWHEELNV